MKAELSANKQNILYLICYMLIYSEIKTTDVLVP